MLAFVTSLRHPQNSGDYGRVEELLQATLRSVCGQSDDDFVVIVVGNRRPGFELPPRVHFVATDFPAPAPPTGPRTARAPFVWDKGTKIGIGLIAARDFDPDYVMIFDADDFVHRDLAAFVNRNAGEPGWVIDQGWMLSRARNAIRPQAQFNRTCGTCYIVAFDVYGVPAEGTTSDSQREVAAAFGERLPTIMGAHREAMEWYTRHGIRLRPLPFRAAVYHVDTGENHSGKSFTGLARPLRPAQAAEFGIVPTQGPLASAWWSFGPVPLWESARRRRHRLWSVARRIGSSVTGRR